MGTLRIHTRIKKSRNTLILSSHSIRRIIERFGWDRKALIKNAKEVALTYFSNYHGRDAEITDSNSITWAIAYVKPYNAVVKTVYEDAKYVNFPIEAAIGDDVIDT